MDCFELVNSIKDELLDACEDITQAVCGSLGIEAIEPGDDDEIVFSPHAQDLFDELQDVLENLIIDKYHFTPLIRSSWINSKRGAS